MRISELLDIKIWDINEQGKDEDFEQLRFELEKVCDIIWLYGEATPMIY